MADRIELRFRSALAEWVPRGSRVVAAVSGGGDSVALLQLLVGAARSKQLDVSVAHLDHGLRRGSRTDRRFVEDLASRLGCPVVAERREVETLRRRDESPEEAARRVRRGFLIEAASGLGAEWVATGHTLDDQAETILMRLARGSGTTGLAGMGPSGPGPFVRPLLDFEGADLRNWLERKGHAFRDDPSNRSLRFDRNRVRHVVLPVIREQLNPRAARHLVDAARRLREDAEYLDALAEELAGRAIRSEDGRVSVDASVAASTDPVLARRVLRTTLLTAGADARRIGSRHIAALLALAHGPGRAEVHLPGGLSARRAGRLIWVEPRQSRPKT